MYDWKKQTQLTLDKFKARNEPVTYVLPTTQGLDCAICKGYIKARKEIIFEFDGYESNPICSDPCWLIYGRRQLFKTYQL